MTQQQQQNPFQDDFKTAMNYAQLAVRLFGMTAEVFLRHSFGERYFNLFSMGCSCILLTVACQLPNHAQLMPFFFLAFLVMCLAHRVSIFKRRRQGVRWHSRYAGTSYGFWHALPFRQHTTQLYFEPVLTFGVGVLIYFVTEDALGLWLMFSGACLGVSGQMDAFRFRSRILDVIDSQIESEQLNASVVELKDPAKTEGFSVPVSLSYFTQAQRVGFADAMRRIDPTLREMMTEESRDGGTPSAAELMREMQEKQAREAEARSLLEQEKARRDAADARIRQIEESLQR